MPTLSRRPQAYCPNRLKPLALALILAASGPATANPDGATVVGGSASISASGSTLTVTNSPGAIINWQNFSIAAGEVTRFAQQSASSTVLNRVTGSNPSSILGSLQSNGHVWLINPNGVIFGQGARIDVAGLVASSLNIADQDFLNGLRRFSGTGAEGAVKNAGNIAASGGPVLLFAPDVENNGIISSPSGEIILAAGHTVEMADSANPALRVALTAGGEALNIGQIVSQNVSMLGGLVRNSGTIDASSAVSEGGRIFLKGTQAVALGAGSVSQANGRTGGGSITVTSGGTTTVGQAAQIQASAIQDGDGGDVLIWSDSASFFDGHVEARGGAENGNGGFVEVSGLKYLDFRGSVDTTAPHGRTGQLLLDPTNITIGTSADVNGDMATGDDLGVNLLYANDYPSVTSLITAAQLGTLLNTTDVSLEASNDITVSSAVSKTGGTLPTTLTLRAGNDINLYADIISTGTAMNLVLRPDYDGVGGGAAKVMGAGPSSPRVLNMAGGKVWVQGTLDVRNALSGGGTGTLDVYSGFIQAAGADISGFHNIFLTQTVGTLSVGNLSTTWTGNYDPTTPTGVIGLEAKGGDIVQQSGTALAGSGVGALASGAVTLEENNPTGVLLGSSGSGFSYKSTSPIMVTRYADADFSHSGISAGTDLKLTSTTGDIVMNEPVSAPGDIVLMTPTDAELNRDLTLTGSTNRLFIYGNLVNKATLRIGAGSQLVSGASNSAINYGSLIIDGAASKVLVSQGFTNKAGGTLTAGGQLVVGGSLTNESSLTIADLGIVSAAAGFTNQAGGIVKLQTGGTLAGAVTVNGGQLSGSGTIVGDVSMNAGTLAPGSSTGALSIVGNLSLGSASTLAMELGAPSNSAASDQINVTGLFTKGGSLQLAATGGYVPAKGDRFTLFTFGSESGGFTSMTLPDTKVSLNGGLLEILLQAGAISAQIVEVLVKSETQISTESGLAFTVAPVDDEGEEKKDSDTTRMVCS